jgi:hypothetical protein
MAALLYGLEGLAAALPPAKGWWMYLLALAVGAWLLLLYVETLQQEAARKDWAKATLLVVLLPIYTLLPPGGIWTLNFACTLGLSASSCI